MLLLENGELHQVFGTVTAGIFTPQGLDWGRYTVSGNTLGAPLTQYNANGSKVTGTLSATVVANASITGSAGSNANSSNVTFSATPSSVNHPGYSYNTPAALADIAGAWPASFVLGQGSGFAMGIDAGSGAIATSNLGCALTGLMLPRSSGQNVFDVNLTVGQAPCANAGQTYSGVAISYLTANGKRQLIATLQSADKALGTVLYALR